MKTLTYTVAAAVAVATPKPPENNQDRSRAFSTPNGACALCCDGVGSHADSGDVAEVCLAIGLGHLQGHGIAAGMKGLAEVVAEQMVDVRDTYEGATTLLAVGAETDGDAHFLMVGNGSIFVIEAFDTTGPRAELKTGSLVVPHMAYSSGQLALRSFLPSPALPIEQSGGLLFATRRQPRLLLACSDGVSTAEDCPVGRTPSGKTWQQLTPPFAVVLEALADAWSELLVTSAAPELLGEVFQSALDKLARDGLLEDDATLAGVLICPSEEPDHESKHVDPERGVGDAVPPGIEATVTALSAPRSERNVEPRMGGYGRHGGRRGGRSGMVHMSPKTEGSR